MRFSQFTDYAFRLLIHVATRPDERNTVEQAAAHNQISRHHLVKVAQRLSQAGILAASRGRYGGLKLARPAAEIGVGDILRATEADFNLVGCQRGEHCVRFGNCGLPPVLASALAAFLAEADRHNLAELIANPRLAISG